jgi:hypothetical protein
MCVVMTALGLRQGNWWPYAFGPPALFLIWGYFRYGAIQLAFQAHLRGRDADVERFLRQTRYPDLLRPSDRAYFEFMHGMLAAAKGEHATAKAHLERAAKGPLRTDNMRSVICCHLAAIAIAEGDKAAAGKQLEQARAIPHQKGTDAMIVQLEEALLAAD